MPTDDEQLRSYFDRLTDDVLDRVPVQRGPSAPVPTQTVTEGVRWRRLAGAVAAAVVAVVSVGSLWGAGDDERSPVTSNETGVGQPGTGNAGLLAPGEVRAMAPSPLEGRSTMAAVWTGREMVLWGGEAPGGFFSDGAAYDPGTDGWRTLAPSPLSARNAPAVVWTGEEVLLWGGHGADGGRRDGAAYDPATDTWRPIADAPMASDGGPQAVWTGDEMLVVAGFNGVSAAAYDPKADEWRTIAPVPGQPAGPETSAVWTGDVMIIRAIYRNAGSSPGMEGGLFAYSPGSDRWTELPRLAEDSRLTAIAYDGERLLRVTQQPGAAIAAYDFASESWTGIARWPAGLPPTGVSVWTGNGLLLWGGDTSVLVDPVDGSITTSPGGGGAVRTNAAAVWADGVLLVWGGFEDVDDGLVLRPAVTDSSGTEAPFTIPEAPPQSGQRTPVAGPDGTVGYLDPTPGPTDVNGRLLSVQRVVDADGNLVGYFACTFLSRDVVEDPGFDPAAACSSVTTVQGDG